MEADVEQPCEHGALGILTALGTCVLIALGIASASDVKAHDARADPGAGHQEPV